MTDLFLRFRFARPGAVPSLCAAPALAQLQLPQRRPRPAGADPRAGFNGDYIVAVVNSELVTAAEVEQRIERIRAATQPRRRGRLPPSRPSCASRRWTR